jgi:ATP-dependent Clp protease, protease subunit
MSTGEQILKKLDEFNAEDRIDLKLLENSVHFLTGDIEDFNIKNCIKWIIYENLDQKDKVLTIYINSVGGNLYDAFALIDVMKTSRHPIRTIVVGSAMSAAFLIFASGTPGQRFVTKNASLMSHQFSESTEGKYHDIKATMKENELCNERMVAVLKDATGLSTAVIKKKLLPASDVYLSAQEAIDLGVADNFL